MILKADIEKKIRARTMFNKPRASIGLHCWPKHQKGERWFAVGPVPYGEDPGVWFELRLATDADYLHVNRLLAEVCRELELPFISMA